LTDDPAAPVTADGTSPRRLISGGAVLALAMLGANGGNYVLNLLLGRWMSPAEFADANLMVTLMLAMSVVAAPLQLVAARCTGMHEASGAAERGRSMIGWLAQRARVVGLGLGAVIGVPAIWWAELFNTESPWPFVIMAAGVPAYLAQAIGRGVLQGRMAFGPLALTFVVEMLVRLGSATALVAAGAGVPGATMGLSLSFFATWALVRWTQPLAGRGEFPPEELAEMRRFLAPTTILLVGQIIVNNGDVLVVKMLFAGETAGIYSAIALMGRAVFFLSWSAVAILFPAAARRNASGAPTDGLLVGGLGVVASLCAAMVAGAAVVGDLFLRSVLGPRYAGLDGFLVDYVVAASLFSVANLVATYQLSLGRMAETRILVVGALVQTILVLVAGRDIGSVIDVQVLAMSGLLVAILGRSLARSRTAVPHRRRRALTAS
jgi:O-antigen/teichoic acid export membrane protein